jgi:hypothetical protein
MSATARRLTFPVPADDAVLRELATAGFLTIHGCAASNSIVTTHDYCR